MTKDAIKRADDLRTGRTYKEVGQNKLKLKICSAPLYRLNDEGLLDLSTPLVEGRYRDNRSGVALSHDLLEPRILTGLADGQFVGETIITVFASMFNYRELCKKRKNPDYRPIHMFGTYFVDVLCFEGGKFLSRKFESSDVFVSQTLYVSLP